MGVSLVCVCDCCVWVCHWWVCDCCVWVCHWWVGDCCVWVCHWWVCDCCVWVCHWWVWVCHWWVGDCCVWVCPQEQFHESLHAPLFDKQSKKSALRPNTHFAAFKRDAMATWVFTRSLSPPSLTPRQRS